MKDLRDVQSQLEQALGALMDAVEQQPDADLAEAVDHVSAALTRLRAAEDTGPVARRSSAQTVDPWSWPQGPTTLSVSLE